MEEGTLIFERISATLMERYFGKGHDLYIDNIYASIRLANYLIENGTNVTGTIRENTKQFPLEIKKASLQKEDAAFYQHDGKVIVKYRAKRDSSRGQPKVVYVLSTSHGAAMKNTNRVDTDCNAIKKPTSIIDYNHNMSDIDSCWSTARQLGCTKKIIQMVEKVLSEAGYALCIGFLQIVQQTRREGDFLSFLQDKCTLLFQNALILERNPSSLAIDNIAGLTGRNHWPLKRETLQEWKAMKSKTKRCRVCIANGRFTRSGKHIKQLGFARGYPEEPRLCVEKECFEMYHNQFDLSV